MCPSGIGPMGSAFFDLPHDSARAGLVSARRQWDESHHGYDVLRIGVWQNGQLVAERWFWSAEHQLEVQIERR